MAENQSDAGPPIYLGVPIASIGTGLLSVIGITAALVEREDTGKGQWVETSMIDGALSFLNMFWERMENFVETPKGPTLAGPATRRLVVSAFRCADGEYVGVHTGANGSHARLIECLGLSERIPPAEGPREKLVPLSDEEAAIMMEEVPQIFASKPRSHWLDLLQANDVTAVPYFRQTEALTQEQPIHNGTPLRLLDPEFGEVTQIGIAARFAATPGEVRGPAPRAGQDTDDVLHELGYTFEEVAELRRATIVA
jgi:crotonobetainyl-CoA:carnitine CoA-transferase CaiB-like acyl-CoA transferase